LPGEGNCYLLTCLGPTSEGDWLVALQDHVIGEERWKLEVCSAQRGDRA
jgi:hypothetical protein